MLSRRVLALAGAAMCALALGGQPLLAAPGQTGQGIMVNLGEIPDELAYDAFDLWIMDRDAASTFFANGWDGNAPTMSCAPAGLCAIGTPPAAPAAPAPVESHVSGLGAISATTENRCTFFSGGALVGHSYTQNEGVQVGLRHYTFTYTYLVTPAVEKVEALTAWVFVLELPGTGGVPVTLSPEIAGLSVLSSRQHPIKRSFSLKNGEGTNRVVNLKVSLDGAQVAAPASTVVQNCPGCLAGEAGAVDFDYTSNAGVFGNTSLLSNGDARALLANDSFVGNENGGADGSALAKAVVDPVEVFVPQGDHTLTFTGTIKGNDGLLDVSFSVSKNITIFDLFGCGTIPAPPIDGRGADGTDLKF